MVGQQLAIQQFFREMKNAATTERYRTATLAEAYFYSLQHADKAPWHNKTVPLRDRQPRMVVPLPRKIIEKIDRFLWSGQRAPRVSVAATYEEGSEAEIGPLLDAEGAEIITGFLSKLIEEAKLLRAAREYTTRALITTSALVVIGVQNGYLNCYVHGGKDCTPKYRDDNPRELESVEIKYQFPKEELQGGVMVTKMYWYRRVIDETTDYVFVEHPVVRGVDPEWTIDKEKTIEHKFGFCPCVWVRTFPDCSDPVDGTPLIDPTLYPIFDAISYTVSQKQRAVEYGCEPQPWRKGVPEDQQTELEKNPGRIWDLPGDSKDDGAVDVGFLEANGSGAQRAGEHLKELHQLVREIVDVVDANPEMHSRAITGAALEMLYLPMTALAEDLRVDFGTEAYCTLINKALRIATVVVQERGEDIWIPGVKKATKIMKDAQMKGVWLNPQITLEWAPFFRESEPDRKAKVESTVTAKEAGAISTRTMVRALAPLFAVTDHAGELEEIEREAIEGSDYGDLAGKNKANTEEDDTAPGKKKLPPVSDEEPAEEVDEVVE